MIDNIYCNWNCRTCINLQIRYKKSNKLKINRSKSFCDWPSRLIVQVFGFQTIIASHLAPALALHVPVWVRFFHGFWRHEVSRESWSCPECVWLVLLCVFFYLYVLLRWWTKIWPETLVTADIPDFHELRVQVVFQVSFFISGKQFFYLWSVSAVFGSIEPDHKDIFLSFGDEILNLWYFLSIGDDNTRITVVLAEYIFETGYIFVGYEGDNIADIIDEFDFEVGVIGFFVEEEGLFGLLVVEGIGEFFVVAVIDNWDWWAFVFEPGGESNAVFVVADALVFRVEFGDDFL